MYPIFKRRKWGRRMRRRHFQRAKMGEGILDVSDFQKAKMGEEKEDGAILKSENGGGERGWRHFEERKWGRRMRMAPF